MSTADVSPILPGDTTAKDPTADGHDGLKDLYARIVDARSGFERMVEKAEPEFRPVAQKFLDLHDRHAAAVAELARGDVDEDGTLIGRINRFAISIRALFDEIDEDVMDQVRFGERRVLKAFDRAIELSDDRTREALIEMKSELVALLDETSHLD